MRSSSSGGRGATSHGLHPRSIGGISPGIIMDSVFGGFADTQVPSQALPRESPNMDNPPRLSTGHRILEGAS